MASADSAGNGELDIELPKIKKEQPNELRTSNKRKSTRMAFKELLEENLPLRRCNRRGHLPAILRRASYYERMKDSMI